MSKVKAIVMKSIDNVATVTQEISPDTNIIVTVNGEKLSIHVIERIPFGHKVAIKDITKDEKIMKYGEVIGTASKDIKEGQHVHVHNLGGVRGRGDLCH